MKGLQIIEGSLTQMSIINDVVPLICRGKALFEKIQSRGGTIVLKKLEALTLGRYYSTPDYLNLG